MAGSHLALRGNRILKDKICILSFSNIARDGRVLRQIYAALSSYQVDVIGYGNWQPPQGVRFFSLSQPSASPPARFLRLMRLLFAKVSPAAAEKAYWMQPAYREALKILQREKYALIHANDWDALPVAALAARNISTRLLFDAHEYTPAQETSWRAFLWTPYKMSLVKHYAKEVDAFVTVSDGIAHLYKENFGWNCSVIKNAPYYQVVKFRPSAPDTIRLVHHGHPIRRRRLEDLIYLVQKLDKRFSLSFILMDTDALYVKELKELAERIAPGRVSFHPACLPNEIVEHISVFDMGIHLFPPFKLNFIYVLPNKFFECIMAGLAVITYEGCLEMADIVRKAGIGITGNSLDSLARQLNNLKVEQLNTFRRRSLELAKQMNAETEMCRLHDLYENLLRT